MSGANEKLRSTIAGSVRCAVDGSVISTGAVMPTLNLIVPPLRGTPAELVGVTARLNNALRRLGSGWAIFIEASRHSAQDYPASRFPDPVSSLVDAERAAQFEEEGAHFESAYYFTFVFLPPAEEAARAESFLYEGVISGGSVDANQILKGFVDRIDRVLQLIEGFVPEAAWLSDTETLTYLHSCISTRRHRVRVPEVPVYLDAILVDEPLVGGLAPRLVQRYTGHEVQDLYELPDGPARNLQTDYNVASTYPEALLR